MNKERLVMRYRFLFIIVLFIGGVNACSPGPFGGLFPEPTPTPPDGFVNLYGLTPPEQFLKFPAFSADGHVLAAIGGSLREETTFGRLFVIDADNVKVLFSTEEKAWVSLAISFDGKRVAACADQQIFLVDREVGTTTFLTDGCWPTWSPDGKHIAYVLYTTDQQQIRIRDLATDAENVIYDAQPTPRFIVDLTWSPMGDRLAFTMAHDSPIAELYTININESDLHKMTDSSQPMISPNFSPNGSKLLYVEQISPYLRVSDLEGKCHRLVPPVPGLLRVAISPEGTNIAFDTIYGLLIADTKTALGMDFWDNGEPCVGSQIE